MRQLRDETVFVRASIRQRLTNPASLFTGLLRGAGMGLASNVLSVGRPRCTAPLGASE
jgi:hypothetical protein